MTVLSAFGRQCRRELLLQIRQPGLLLNAALFFIMITVFFPLTLPANMAILRQVAPGLVWMAMLLAMLLVSERLFQQDYEDGILEQWLACGQALSSRVFAKILMHWLMIILPLLCLCPFLSLLFGFSWRELLILCASLLLGTPAILSICALAAAFSTGMTQRGMTMALVLLPLTVPVMIFGSGTVNATMQGLPVSAYLILLSALSILAMSFLPFAVAAVIRIGLAD